MVLWVKAIHVAAIVTWVGGLLMMAMLLAAVVEAPTPRRPQERRLMIAVSRWDRMVTTPAMLLAWLLGVTMAVKGGWLTAPRLMAKLVLVVALSALHGTLAGMLRKLCGEVSQRPFPSVRFASVFTVMAAVAIALLVVLKPF
jgi:protoporphyrinogen IX oxidase